MMGALQQPTLPALWSPSPCNPFGLGPSAEAASWGDARRSLWQAARWCGHQRKGNTTHPSSELLHLP